MVGVTNANATPSATMPAIAPFSPTAQVRSLKEERQGHAASAGAERNPRHPRTTIYESQQSVLSQ